MSFSAGKVVLWLEVCFNKGKNKKNSQIILTYRKIIDKIGFKKIKKHLRPTDANYFYKQFVLSATNT